MGTWEDLTFALPDLRSGGREGAKKFLFLEVERRKLGQWAGLLRISLL